MRDMRKLLTAVVSLLVACGPGPVGPQGPAGPPGPSGITLQSTLHCSDVTTVNGFSFFYDMARFSDRSAFVSCEVGTAAGGHTSSAFYGSAQQGSGDGACIVSFDSDGPAGFGYWVFTSAATTASATYNDKGAPSDTYKLTLACK